MTIGHNGGPALDDRLPAPPRSARCDACRHYRQPRAQEVRWYEQRGNRPMREPRGHCFQLRLTDRANAITAFSSRLSSALACYGFDPAPPVYRPGVGGGFVTISEGGRVVWQGQEGTEPAHLRDDQRELNL